ncbi:hypothetical protein LguiA_032761 [Lonicera macranthoides]
MDLKRFSFSDQFPYCVSPTRKVISRFRLGIVASLIVLTVVLFNISFKAPFFNPVFQGFNNSSGANSTSLISWPFSFSSTTSTSISGNATSVATISAAKLDDSVGSIQMGETHEAIMGTNGTIMNYDNGQGIDLKEKTPMGNFSGNVNSGIAEKAMESKRDIYGNESSISTSVGSKDISNSSVNIGQLADTKNQSLEGNNLTTISHNDSQIGERGNSFHGKCNIFDGRWVRDDTKPYYPAGSCPYIDRDFDCHLNKRPDDAFVKWKWLPYGCEIPSLNATDFLERLRGKKMVFVGDSLNRNMWESLVCILRQSVQNKERVYEISGRTEFKKKGFYAFRFEDYNCTVDFVGSPFLVRELSVSGKNGSIETLRLDLMDQTTSMYHDADVLVFNTGHWWTHEKTSKGEDYYQEGDHVYPRLKVLDAYKRALGTWARWIDKNIDGSRTQVIFRGYSVTHFRRGEWNSGGQCHKETEPALNGTHLAKYPSKMRALEYVLRDMKTPVIYLNVSRLTAYRKDAHPSIYRMEYKTVEDQIAAVHSQDCSHWCLPGVPDTWNELLYASLLKVGRGS